MAGAVKARLSGKHVDQDTGSNRRTDNACHVGAHGVHQQVVAGVVLLADLLGNTGGHRHGGNTGRADERVDLAVGDNAHDLAQQHTACGADAEGDDAQNDDLDGLQVQEGRGVGGAADGEAQEDGDDVHQFVAGGLGDTLDHAGFLHQVAHHQAADQQGGVRQRQGNDDGNDDGEQNLLGLGNLARGFHNDLTFFFGSQRLHDGRLNDRHQRHVAVRRHGNGAQQVRGQLGGNVDSGGAVGAADDTDGGSLAVGEAEDLSADKGEEDAQLCGSAQQQAGGAGDQRGEVGHGADAQEDQRGVNAQLDAQVDVVRHAAGGTQQGPVDVVGLVDEDVHVENAVQRQVGHQHAKADGQKQQRLKLLGNGQVQQHAGHGDHDGILPAALDKEDLCPAGVGKDLTDIG